VTVAENQSPRAFTDLNFKTAVTSELAQYAGLLATWIGEPLDGSPVFDPQRFEEMAVRLFRLQYALNGPFRHWCQFRGVVPENVAKARDIPGLPISAFKELEVTCLAPGERSLFFLSSGTTGQQRSRQFHSHESVALYDRSAMRWFAANLLKDFVDATPRAEGPRVLGLTPAAIDAPHSSLGRMVVKVIEQFGAKGSETVGTVDSTGTWALDWERLDRWLGRASDGRRPVIILGTAFQFVHLLEHAFENRFRWNLPEGSLVMETGGYKGRSQEMPKATLHAGIAEVLGVNRERIISEYGMSELSSQAYTGATGKPNEGCLRFPPWARCRVISPETGAEVALGETGVVVVQDLANVWSAFSVQTEDLAVRRDEGFELLGRAAKSEPRGCSLMTSEP
jgi:hypothetical protein